MVEASPSNPRGLGMIPGRGAELRSHMPRGQKTKHKQYSNKFNKDFTMVHIKKKILKETDSLDYTVIAEVISSSQTGNVVGFFLSLFPNSLVRILSLAFLTVFPKS